ncbi:serine/threonine protein phosphatase [Pseudomonas sp. BN415]|uniref:metallophosphoesterase n=1 Tax=Pseudomonas sp. BN415 TaxID=2567889 RepID=UPI0024551AAD|nr:metallophosphoesterase [Pseudomonas sp. BN415]MDH4581397.1 serine/threonine protein phosphatase [Pseudomonas sp. BN415]
MSVIKRFGINTAGRDFAVGDIHGHFTRLQAALDAAGFDPVVDRLFSVGDLVDRGPESEQVLEWLAKSWFFAIRGNHEDMVITANADLHFVNGGAWFYGLSHFERADIVAQLGQLPLLIEVEVPNGLIGLVHADVPCADWADLKSAFDGGGMEAEHVAAMCQWSRKRVTNSDSSGVSGISAVVVGHTPVRRPAVLGNVIHIDTGGWLPEERGGYFTLLNLHTLEAIPPMPAKLEWEVA